MVASLFPLQYLVATLALWLNRHQQEVIDYLKEENRFLKAKLGGRRIQVTAASMPRAEAVVSKNSDDTLARCKNERMSVARRLTVYFPLWSPRYFRFSI